MNARDRASPRAADQGIRGHAAGKAVALPVDIFRKENPMSTRLSLMLGSALALAAPAAYADTTTPAAVEHVSTTKAVTPAAP